MFIQTQILAQESCQLKFPGFFELVDDRSLRLRGFLKLTGRGQSHGQSWTPSSKPSPCSLRTSDSMICRARRSSRTAGSGAAASNRAKALAMSDPGKRQRCVLQERAGLAICAAVHRRHRLHQPREAILRLQRAAIPYSRPASSSFLWRIRRLAS